MSKVLLTTPCQPYPTHAWNDSLTDVMSQRFTKGQDIFTLSGHMHCYGSHIIAQNLSVPSVFLEYPFREDFEAEVRKNYDFVGISFFPTCMNIVLEMCQTVRRLSPQSKIVLGHYGALAFDAAFPEDFKKEHADYVCIGEGASFFRQLLGEPVEVPIHQSHLPKCGNNLPWLDAYPKGNMGFTIAGLGCPSGCDFCSTTQMHQNRWIMLTEPKEIFEEMKRCFREDPDVQQVAIYDEDLFKHKDYVMELSRLIQADEELGLRKLDWFTLASIESLSQYTWEEIALSGLGGVFIGLESKFAPDSGYQKRAGDAQETFSNLLKWGIQITSGWMCGFDFHDRVNLVEDFNYLVSLEPTGHQLTKVTAFPGTPFWERMKEEGRIHDDTPWEDVNFYGGGFKHKNFEDHEIMDFLLKGYRKLYKTWGPTLMRQFRLQLNGYESCRASSNPLLREHRSKRHRNYCRQLYPLARASEHFAPNGIVRRQIGQLHNRYVKNFGPPSTAQSVQSYYVLAKAFQEKLRGAILSQNREPRQEPFKKYVYPSAGERHPGRPPYRVFYPRTDWKYELDRKWMRTKNQAFDQLLGTLDRLDEWRGAKLLEEQDHAFRSLKFL